jgi:hypothetical protein
LEEKYGKTKGVSETHLETKALPRRCREHDERVLSVENTQDCFLLVGSQVRVSKGLSQDLVDHGKLVFLDFWRGRCVDDSGAFVDSIGLSSVAFAFRRGDGRIWGR